MNNRMFAILRSFFVVMAASISAGCGTGGNGGNDGISPDSGMAYLDGSVTDSDGDQPDQGTGFCHPTGFDRTASRCTMGCTCAPYYIHPDGPPPYLPDTCRSSIDEWGNLEVCEDLSRCDMLRACREEQTCAPGQNHCSFHFPPGVYNEPFACASRAHDLWYLYGGSSEAYSFFNFSIFSNDTVNGLYSFENFGFAAERIPGRRDLQGLSGGVLSGNHAYQYVGLARRMPNRIVEYAIWTFRADCSRARIDVYPSSADPANPGMPLYTRELHYSGPNRQ